MASTSSQPLIQHPEAQISKKRLWCSNRVQTEPEAKLCLKASLKTFSCYLLIRELLPLIAIIFVIVFGATWKIFNFRDVSVLGLGVNVDIQLALIGLLNKILDLFVQASLKHTASIFLTVWMALHSKHSGVNIKDLELKDELTQPWTCIANFWKRCSTLGWKGIGNWGLFRFIACLAVSICVLLLALAVNTVGIPKERWYPSGAAAGWKLTDDVRKRMTVTTPRMILVGMDWTNAWDKGFDLILTEATPPGWQPIPSEMDGLVTGMNTVVNKSTVQSISVQNSMVQDIYNELKVNGSEQFYKDSSGWNGFINLTVPMLTTSCIPGLGLNSSTLIGTIPVDSPTESSPTESQLTVRIGSIPSLNFTGAICTVIFNQVLFPVGTWIISKGNIGVSINNYGANMNSTPLLLVPSTGNRACAEALAVELNKVVGRVNGLLDTGLVYHMVLISRRLSSFTSAISAVNDTAGISITLAAIAQHLLTVGAWNMTVSPDPNEKTTSYPVIWQVYASGPREVWEWTAVIIFAVILLALSLGVYVTTAWQVEPGPWLDIGGMMLAANEADTMESVAGSVMGAASQAAKEAKFYVRELESGQDVVALVDETEKTHELTKTKTYMPERPTIISI